MDPMLTDEERLAEIKKWWKKNGLSLFGGLTLGVAIVLGWGYLKSSKQTKDIQASQQYNIWIAKLSQYERRRMLLSKPDKKLESLISVKLETLIKDYGDTVYAVDSSLILAKMAVSNSNLKEAQKRLQWVVTKTDSDSYKHHLGRIRLARVQRDLKQYSEALNTLNINFPKQYTVMYNYIKGTVYESQKQCSQARSAYQISIKIMDAKKARAQKSLKQTIQRRLENVQNC